MTMQLARTYSLHAGLLALTFVTATLAGVNWANRDPFALENFGYGVDYAILLLLVLGSHELGHYVAARRNGIRSTLPFFIPLPPFYGTIHFGTLGAVIKLQEPLRSRKEILDIGAAGPIAGFIVSSVILAIGFSTLPPIDFLYTFHPEYAQMSSIPTDGPAFGNTIFFSAMAKLFAPAGAFVPPMNEVYHYPFLCVGWFGLFVTAMNLIPVGQLDGGHITYAMFGAKARRIGQVSLAVLFVLGVGEFLPLLGLDVKWGWTGWLFWAALLAVFTRGLTRDRPPLSDETSLDAKRRTIGWICVLVFLCSFAVSPFSISIP
jgi:membrane-associated protease RseP (regulator of RpoE activity)